MLRPTTTTTRPTPTTQDIRKRFEEEYGAPMQTASVLSYQAVEVIAQALEEAGERRPRRPARRHRRDLPDDPLLAFDGPIKFDETGQNKNATAS